MVMIVALLVALVLAPTLVPAHGNDRNEPTAKAPWNATLTDTLKKSLLLGYDKFSRPSDFRVPIDVTLGLSFHHIDLDDKTGVMTIDCWVSMQWNDEKLKWNSSEYGGMRNLNIPDHEIWQPDIVHYMSASNTAYDQYANTHCVVNENGGVIWVPPAKISTFCDLDLTRWPYDEQKCFFKFGSWTYDITQINIHDSNRFTIENNNEYEHYVENGEWELVNMSSSRHETFYPCCENSYVSIDFGIHVKRRNGGGAHGVLVIAPVVVSALLTLMTHFLPPRSPLALRIPLAASLTAILALSLLYFSYRLPSATKTPNIVMIYCISLYMTCISGIVSVIVLNMSMARKSLPWAVRKVLSSGIGRCLQLPKLADHSNAEELQGSVVGVVGSGGEEGARILSGPSPPSRDWLALATAIDRLTFIVLLSAYSIIAIVYGF